MYNGTNELPYSYMSLSEEIIPEEWKQVCSSDDDCTDSEICLKYKENWGQANEVWAILNVCSQDNLSIEETCYLIGDYTIIEGDENDENIDTYSISFNCDRYKVDIGGAHTIAFTIFEA